MKNQGKNKNTRGWGEDTAKQQEEFGTDLGQSSHRHRNTPEDELAGRREHDDQSSTSKDTEIDLNEINSEVDDDEDNT